MLALHPQSASSASSAPSKPVLGHMERPYVILCNVFRIPFAAARVQSHAPAPVHDPKRSKPLKINALRHLAPRKMLQMQQKCGSPSPAIPSGPVHPKQTHQEPTDSIKRPSAPPKTPFFL